MVAVVEVQERRCVPPAGFAPGRIEQENRRAHDVAADPAIAEPIPELVQRRYPTDRCVLEDHVASLRLRRIRNQATSPAQTHRHDLRSSWTASAVKPL